MKKIRLALLGFVVVFIAGLFVVLPRTASSEQGDAKQVSSADTRYEKAAKKETKEEKEKRMKKMKEAKEREKRIKKRKATKEKEKKIKDMKEEKENSGKSSAAI